MANLTAVLRKTIDGLPNATPQIRAKVYEKARAAITRQIQAASPPLEDHVVEARYRVLEDAILETEAHYQGTEAGGDAPDPVREPAPIPSEALARPAPRPAEEPAAVPTPAPQSPEAARPAPAEPPAPVRPAFPRVTPTLRPAPALQETPPALGRPQDEGSLGAPMRSTWGDAPRTDPPLGARAEARAVPPVRAEPEIEAKVGEVGPSEEAARPAARPGPALRPAGGIGLRDDERPRASSPAAPAFPGIPEADMAAPRYPARRQGGRSRAPVAAGLVILLLAGLGTAGWFYREDIRAFVGSGSSEVASVSPTPATPTTDEGETPIAPSETDEPPAVAVPPSGTPADTAPQAPAQPGGVQPRQFTQRLMPDGSEIDAGPGASVANAFEEGTDVAAASMNTPATTPEAVTPTAPAAGTPATGAPAEAPPAASADASVPVGQRAVFYEERSAEREGSQQSGNVVWSVVNEPPAEGQPPEPAIRAVADIPNDDLKMTLTIRRNADTTLPASHVIEILFDTPSTFPGGSIDNVQRLALKPTEQARGEPLIGVAGKISDGFFIIALNDLKQAVDSNLGLLGREEWIDIPLAYATGQRALMSIEKGIPGDRVFKEAMDAWAAKT